MDDQKTVGGSGKLLRWRQSIFFLLVLVAPLSEAKEDAGSLWVSAYCLVQTGDRLASAELWPLAIGSYIEADRQIKELASEHPAFEPDVIGYRLEKLQEDIESAQENLIPGEHDVMMKYLDFIESYELGQKQRFDNKFEDSLTTLSEARSLLDELIAEKPDEFEAAVKTQDELLNSSIDWLYSRVDFKVLSSHVVAFGGDYDWGSTQYVKESDLPSRADSVELFGGLFPEVLLSVLPGNMDAEENQPVAPEKTEGEGKDENKEGKSGGRLRFRMNSQSDPIGVELDREAE